ncbi:MAG: ATP-binding protein [Bacteroidia bacterium]|nr:ATP-binding protein [Bacteroidia bacterium]
MIERRLTTRLLRDLEWSPIVGLVGSRQVGKTTLVQHLRSRLSKPSIYLDLELQEDLFKLEDAQSYLSGHQDKTVIIDEIQVKPELFALLRGLTDQKREPARFILLGSASPHIVKLNTETLAGRISYHELPPFSLSEVMTYTGQEQHWIKGGFPQSLLAPSTQISRKWLDDFVETFIYRDLARLGFAIPASLLRNLLHMLAHLHGSMLNISNLASSLGVSTAMVNKYLELLEGSFLIRRLPPWFENMSKRLVKSPKIYLRDSGLLHYLLRVFDMETLRGNPAVGMSWEGYVIEQIIREAPEFSEFYFYRTQHGAESDLLMITPAGKKVCIEIKFSIAPVISKGFFQSREDLKPDYSYVITPGGECFDRADGLRICPLNTFLERELGELV